MQSGKLSQRSMGIKSRNSSYIANAFGSLDLSGTERNFGQTGKNPLSIYMKINAKWKTKK